MYIAKEVGELFDVAVNVSNVQNLHSLKFTMTYNSSLLNVEQVVQGPFFPQPPRSYFELEKNATAGFIRVNMTLAESEAPRSGSGTLIRIGLKVIQGPTSCVSSSLNLQQTLLLNSALIPITHDSVGAVYFWKSTLLDPPLEGLVFDLYTQKGGQGPDVPGGEFIIGEMVNLTAQVMYNNAPLQLKLVAFEVLNPFNETAVVRTALTDQDGFAKISFRIPYSLNSTGVWIAVSVVEIREEIVWDTLSFQVSLPPPILRIVGGYSFSIEENTAAKSSSFYPALVAILTASFAVIKRKIHRRTRR